MKKTVLMSALIVLCLCASCSNDEPKDTISDRYPKNPELQYANYFTKQDFEQFVNNYIFQYVEYYSLTNAKPIAETRANTLPMIYNDTQGEWLRYCPTSFFFENGELYCNAQMDLATYEQWQAYSAKHKIELYVHSPYSYNESDGTINTAGNIIPAEKSGCIYHFAKNNDDLINTLLAIDLNEPLTGDHDGKTKFNYMYIPYSRISRYYPFDTELKVFDTNEEAIAYAKELMAQ